MPFKPAFKPPAPDGGGTPPGPPPTPVDPPRQRWRLVVARGSDAPPLPQRELADAWLATMEAAGLPLARADGPPGRPRISFGAPLPQTMAAEGELIDVLLTDRWPAWRVREAVEPRLPEGWRVVALEDVWLGGPPLAGRVAAADYRIELEPAGAPAAAELADACGALLRAREVLRTRAKGDRETQYDLRPLVVDVRPLEGAAAIGVRARTRFHPELGTGRPEEVVGALAAILGRELPVVSIVRERLLLIDDLALISRAG